jgi:hypothetical protein
MCLFSPIVIVSLYLSVDDFRLFKEEVLLNFNFFEILFFKIKSL